MALCLGERAAWGFAPDARGPYGIGESRVRVADGANEGTLPVLVFFPVARSDAPPGSSGFPLLVFSPGFFLAGASYRSYGEHLASHGFVVALPTLLGWLGTEGHLDLVADVCAVAEGCLALARTPGDALFGLVDGTAIGAVGHSFGGKLCLMQALVDSRVGAVAAIDPVDGGGMLPDSPDRYPSLAPERMAELEVPLLIVGSERASTPFLVVPCVPERQNYTLFFDAARPPALEIVQHGAGHGQYIDPGMGPLSLVCAPGTVSGEWVRAGAAAYVTAFFLGTLAGHPEALAWLDARLEDEVAQDLVTVRRK